MGNTCACIRDYRVSAYHQNCEETEENEVQWKQGKLLSQGQHGAVYDCLDMRTGKIYAVKHLQPSSAALQSDQFTALREHIKLLRTLEHPNILKYIAVEAVPGSRGVYIIMENASGGSLKDLSDSAGMNEGLVLKFTKQLLEGLNFLHREGFIHTDVKASNLLLSNTQGLKIGDLGRCVRAGDKQPGIVGSPYWMAPEVARGEACTYYSDIWSVGCTIIEMLTGKPPWQEVNPNAGSILDHLRNTTDPPAFPNEISEECQTLLSYCLRINPRTRAKAKALLRMSWLNNS